MSMEQRDVPPGLELSLGVSRAISVKIFNINNRA